MAQDLSIEDGDAVYFITIRTISSRLWFLRNEELQRYILAFLAKYQQYFSVVIFAFILMGNHIHLIAKFPKGNKSSFLKAFNGIVARLVCTHVKEYEGGRLWARRARPQILPRPADIEHWFLYAALNPVSSGLCHDFSAYKEYNSFSDAISGTERTYKLFNRSDFQNRSRKNLNLHPDDCMQEYRLVYSRIPGYEHLTASEYRAEMLEKAERMRQEIVQRRLNDGKGFATPKSLAATPIGSIPHSTKTSSRNTPRPLVLSLCVEAKQLCLSKYFNTLRSYRIASELYRAGDSNVVFPKGTYKPSFLFP